MSKAHTAKGVLSWLLPFVSGAAALGLCPDARADALTEATMQTMQTTHGCSSALSSLSSFVDLDAMLFQAQVPQCGGIQAFDIAFLAIVALVVISAIRFRHATSRRRLDLARRMVEKGFEPPAELLGSPTGSDRRRGLILVCTGIGLLVASWIAGDSGVSPAGLIPGFIGVGYLISHQFAIRARE